MHDDLLTDVCDVIRKVFAQPNLTLSQNTVAQEVPGWDSLNHLFLVMELERRFSIALSPEEASDLLNIGALCDLIASRQSVRANGSAP